MVESKVWDHTKNLFKILLKKVSGFWKIRNKEKLQNTLHAIRSS